MCTIMASSVLTIITWLPKRTLIMSTAIDPRSWLISQPQMVHPFLLVCSNQKLTWWVSSQYNYRLKSSQVVVFVKCNITSKIHLFFAGEWSGQWLVPGPSKEEWKRYIKAQLDVYEKATFGWAFYSLKNVNNYWSIKWLIENGYIEL